MASERKKVRLVSEEGTGTAYPTTVKSNQQTKLRIKKYDPKAVKDGRRGAHVWFKQEKMK